MKDTLDHYETMSFVVTGLCKKVIVSPRFFSASVFFPLCSQRVE